MISKANCYEVGSLAAIEALPRVHKKAAQIIKSLQNELLAPEIHNLIRKAGFLPQGRCALHLQNSV